MRPEITSWLEANPDLAFYLHRNPTWYSTLSRHPEQWKQFKQSADEFYQRTLPHKVKRVEQQLGFASMFFSMMQQAEGQDE
ncbi:YlbE-like family protein [Aureibacillus halotolerans]|uniref:YlbE-like protein n=1 Tax=Aureibacillus halotolerans TaxID=1508390 RepID=A0A4R6U902_9BACI|nr:YlbE-like family protein [Aureibacillus halotolerans]TDQ42296.1 YlbE-like protein [Aureibacillus halotolerans]